MLAVTCTGITSLNVYVGLPNITDYLFDTPLVRFEHSTTQRHTGPAQPPFCGSNTTGPCRVRLAQLESHLWRYDGSSYLLLIAADCWTNAHMPRPGRPTGERAKQADVPAIDHCSDYKFAKNQALPRIEHCSDRPISFSCFPSSIIKASDYIAAQAYKNQYQRRSNLFFLFVFSCFWIFCLKYQKMLSNLKFVHKFRKDSCFHLKIFQKWLCFHNLFIFYKNLEKLQKFFVFLGDVQD